MVLHDGTKADNSNIGDDNVDEGDRYHSDDTVTVTPDDARTAHTKINKRMLAFLRSIIFNIQQLN